MRKLIYSILIISLTLNSCSSCKKETSPTNDNPWGLPNATQEGKNTLGFLLNGQPWTPKGNNGTSNLSIDIDFGFKNGILGIAAYNQASPTTRTRISFGLNDSLNFFNIPFSISTNESKLFEVKFFNDVCDYFSADSTTYKKGEFRINKLDKINHIVAGSFFITLYQTGCDTIKITEGRFDMKF